MVLAWWLRRRLPRLAGAGFAAGALTIWLAATPAVASLWIGSIEGLVPALPPGADVSAAQGIVVLSGGRSFNAPEYGAAQPDRTTSARMRYAARLARSSGLPVIPTGGGRARYGAPVGELMAQSFKQDYGIEVAAVEGAAVDTRENALRTRSLKPEWRTVVIVTSAFHMPRSVRAFEAAGFTVIAAPTDYRAEPIDSLYSWIPNQRALLTTQLAFQESLARVLALI
ncbi:hypothetical protein IP84_03255 [beta proteobacterium AAP99]|nr:hypothetical protein IP84_03255 [beta proteobacterium AAP99]